jgi:hypothetical protein
MIVLVGMKSWVVGLLDLRFFVSRVGRLVTYYLGVSCRPLINLGSSIKVVKTWEHHLKIRLIIIKFELFSMR